MGGIRLPPSFGRQVYVRTGGGGMGRGMRPLTRMYEGNTNESVESFLALRHEHVHTLNIKILAKFTLR